MRKIIVIAILGTILISGCTMLKLPEVIKQKLNFDNQPASTSSPESDAEPAGQDEEQSMEPIIEITPLNIFSRDDYHFVYEVDTANSRVEWTGRRANGEAYSGTVKLKEGQVFVKNDELINALFVVDMTSIEGSGSGNIVDLANGKDFFDVDKYPKADLIVNNVETTGKNSGGETIYKADGKLKIKDVSREIGLAARGKLDTEAGTFQAEAEMSIDRTEWGIRYGSGRYFDNLGGQAIDDMIELKISIDAKKVEP